MNKKAYRIVWYSTVTDKQGKGKVFWHRNYLDKLCAQMNAKYPHIKHEVIEVEVKS